MVRYLLKNGRMQPDEIAYVQNSHELLQNLEIKDSKTVEPEVVTLSTLKNIYTNAWKSGNKGSWSMSMSIFTENFAGKGNLFLILILNNSIN